MIKETQISNMQKSGKDWEIWSFSGYVDLNCKTGNIKNTNTF